MLPLILLIAVAGACLAAPVSRLLGRAGGWGLALLLAALQPGEPAKAAAMAAVR